MERQEENWKEKVKEYTFEEALKRLEEVVELLESGEVPLEEAIDLYHEGILLSRHCDMKLAQVEHKIQMLVEEEGQLVTREFEVEEE